MVILLIIITLSYLIRFIDGEAITFQGFISCLNIPLIALCLILSATLIRKREELNIKNNQYSKSKFKRGV